MQQEIIEFLRGSTNSLDYALETFNAHHLQDDMSFLGELDSQIFYCETCGWWCDLDELASDGECEDCAEE
jgi:hypothetical protein